MVRSGDAIGGYRVVSLVGTGEMGAVWLADHELLGRRVALKLLRPELSGRAEIVDRFFDEARAAAQIDDPGTVVVHDFGRHAGSAYIVMEYLAGEVLSARLARVERLPVAVAARLVMQAALTMAVAHGRGIVHRDLKPDNLFVVPDPAAIGGERVKILDFGIAKLIADNDTGARTEVGAILGTPMYMSPEQCRNAGGVDHRTDVYALGGVLFHLVCGRPPFTGTSSGDLIASHLLDVPVAASSLVRGVPAAFDAVLARCLAKSPDERFGSMTELARVLAPLAGLSIDIPTIAPMIAGRATPTRALPPTSPTARPEARRVRRRSRTWLVLTIAAAVAAVAVTIAVSTTTGAVDARGAVPTPAIAAPVPPPPAVPPPRPAVEPPAATARTVKRAPIAPVRRSAIDTPRGSASLRAPAEPGLSIKARPPAVTPPDGRDDGAYEDR